MINVVIVFQAAEVTLAVNHPVEIKTTVLEGHICGITPHEEDAESVNGYLQYVNWENVQAVLQYKSPEKECGKEGPEHGKETG